MKKFYRIKKIHGKKYKYEITPYYDKENKKIRQKSRYIGPVSDGKLVEKTVTTYSYGDLLPVMKVLKDINLPGMLRNIVGNQSHAREMTHEGSLWIRIGRAVRILNETGIKPSDRILVGALPESG